jgi:hypothetical protein
MILQAANVQYSRDIQPILADNCYSCHGPDKENRKADLRFDTREGALAMHGDNAAIVAGHPEKSELVRRILSADAAEQMPPPDAHRKLTGTQKKLLESWIAEGAAWSKHWSLIPPERSPVPQETNTAHSPGWIRNPIDAFVLARLEQEGLPHAPEASKETLIRRVSLDLTGLLPTPQETSDFLADKSPAAYEKVVERLLASERYGEHRARYWMDYARFGDTQGLHTDDYQSRWPYRDYVIRAFNADMPYDQFTREQLAGDLLPPTHVDQLTATGFIRCGISTGEGGSIIEEVRCNVKRERTEAYGAVFMGMTVGCAVCHDHKYDPISTKDFYALSAFFNNLSEKASCDDRADWPPNITVPPDKTRAAYDAALQKKSGILKQLAARRKESGTLISGWLAAGNRPQPVAPTGLSLHLPLDENYQEASEGSTLLHNTAPGASPATITTTGPKPHWGEETWLWPTFRLETNTRVDLGRAGDFEKDQPFSCGGWMKLRNVVGGNIWNTPAGALLARMDISHHFRGWDVYYQNGSIIVQLVSAWPDAISVQTVGTTQYRSPFTPSEGSNDGTDSTSTLPRGQWGHVFFTYDGSCTAAGLKVYVDGVLQKVKVGLDHLTGSIRTDVPAWLGRRHDGEPMQATSYQDLRFYNRALSSAEVARLPREDVAAEILAHKKLGDLSTDERKIVEDFFYEEIDSPSKELNAQLPAIDAELVRLAAGGPVTLVCREKPGLPYADVLTRGVFGARAERVMADVPHFLPPLPPDAPRDRLGLAEWTVSKANPLTARVAVNRAWQEVFGLGLVETSEDFGVVGERPSHPQLLDWLATDFMESGWKVKRLYKTFVMSATYRQSAGTTAEIIAKDPKNRLLARGPRFRMEGEMLRDCALQAAGLLSKTIGGPSVKPYQPTGVWEAGSYGGSNTQHYHQEHGESLYRRSLYTFWKRMAPMPNLEAFDATDRSSSCVRRQRTNTPLAALVVMNDPQYLEAARHLAVRALGEGGTSADARIDFIGRVLLAHPLAADDHKILLEALAKFQAGFTKNPVAAQQLLAVGESPVDTKLPAIEQAAWMMMATTVMNSDESLNK